MQVNQLRYYTFWEGHEKPQGLLFIHFSKENNVFIIVILTKVIITYNDLF